LSTQHVPVEEVPAYSYTVSTPVQNVPIEDFAVDPMSAPVLMEDVPVDCSPVLHYLLLQPVGRCEDTAQHPQESQDIVEESISYQDETKFIINQDVSCLDKRIVFDFAQF